MNILQRSMASQGILNDTQTTLADYLMSIAQISVEDAGAIYIFSPDPQEIEKDPLFHQKK